MKKINIGVLTFLVALLAIHSCNEDCNECFTPPQPLLFEVVSEDSRDNLISNGTYTSKDIEIVNQSNDQLVEFSISQNGDSDILNINTIGWQTETINYLITANDESLFTLQLNAQRISEDCCSYTKYSDIEISGSDYEINPETGIYSILVP
jgi:hypothetical protein